MQIKKLNVIGVVLARLDSRRLPGKALIPISGAPLCSYVFKRARRIEGLSELVLATTDRPVDDPLVEYAQSESVPVYRGDCEDVALRVLNCVKTYRADFFVRINGDSPFLDPHIIDQGIIMCREEQPDLVTNLIPRTFPYGVSVEVVNARSFEKVYKKMTQPEDHEHVTRYFYEHLSEFDIKEIHSCHPELNSVRLVIDTPTDLAIFKMIVDELKERAAVADYVTVASAYLNQSRRILE